MNDSNGKRSYNPEKDAVPILTSHSSKGLEFDNTIIIGAGQLGTGDRSEPDDAKLLYIGMTRAREKLIVTASRKTAFTKKMEALVA